MKQSWAITAHHGNTLVLYMSSLPSVHTMTQQARETGESVSGAESQSRMSLDSRTKRTSQSSCRLLLWEEREREGKGREKTVLSQSWPYW